MLVGFIIFNLTLKIPDITLDQLLKHDTHIVEFCKVKDLGAVKFIVIVVVISRLDVLGINIDCASAIILYFVLDIVGLLASTTAAVLILDCMRIANIARITRAIAQQATLVG